MDSNNKLHFINIPKVIQLYSTQFCLIKELFSFGSSCRYIHSLISGDSSIWRYNKLCINQNHANSVDLCALVNNTSLLNRGLKYIPNLSINNISSSDGFNGLSQFSHLHSLNLTFQQPLIKECSFIGRYFESNSRFLSNLTRLVVNEGPDDILLLIPKFINLVYLQCIVYDQPAFTHLDSSVANYKAFTLEWFQLIATNCSELEYIQFPRISFPLEACRLLLENLSSIKNISTVLRNHQFKEYCKLLGSHPRAENFQMLQFEHNKVDNEALKYLAEGYRFINIETLELNDCTIRGEGFQYFSKEYFPKLKSLILGPLNGFDYNDWMNIPNNIQLTNIKQLKAKKLSDLELVHFISIFPNLTSLSLSECCFSSAGLLLLLDSLPSLYYLQLSNFPVLEEYCWNSALEEEYKLSDGIIGCFPDSWFTVKQFSEWQNNNEIKQQFIEYNIQEMKETVEQLKFDSITGLLVELPRDKQLYLYYSILQLWPEYNEYDYITDKYIFSDKDPRRTIHGERLKLFHQQLKTIMANKQCNTSTNNNISNTISCAISPNHKEIRDE